VQRNDNASTSVRPSLEVTALTPEGYKAWAGYIYVPSGNPLTAKTWYNGSILRVDPWGNDYSIIGDVEQEAGYNRRCFMSLVDPVTGRKNIAEIWEAGLEFHYTTKPVVSSVTVTGFATSPRPTFGWAYSDGDAIEQEAVHIVVHATAGLASGNPAAAGWAANQVVYTSQTSTVLPQGLAFGVTYSAYIRAGKRMSNGCVIWGAWAESSTFSITAPAPQTPTLSVAQNNTYERTAITVTDVGNRLTWENSSFESGGESTRTWAADDANTTAIGSVQTPTADHGIRSIRATPAGTSTVTLVCEQPISIEPSTSYSVTGRTRAAVDATNLASMGIRWLDVNGAVISTVWGTDTASSTTAWVTITATATSPANAAFAKPMFRMKTPNSTVDYAYLDKVSFGTTTTWYTGMDNPVVEVQRSDDGQVNWTTIYKSGAANNSFGVTRIRDLGARRGVLTAWRARITGTIAGVRASSAWSTVQTLTPTGNAGTWRLVSYSPNQTVPIRGTQLTSNVATFTTDRDHGLQPGDQILVSNCAAAYNNTSTVVSVRSVPTFDTFTVAITNANIAFAVAAGVVEKVLSVGPLKVESANTAIDEAVGVFRTIGSEAPTVVGSDVWTEQGTLQLTTTTETEWASVKRVIGSGDRCALIDPAGALTWVRFTGRSIDKSGAANNIVRRISAEYVVLEDA
jgi:hypothetical protein